MRHIPVFLNEVLSSLDPKPGETFVDATANGGGHLMALAERVGTTGKVFGIELDPVIFGTLQETIKKSSLNNIRIANDSYANIAALVEREKLEPINGILFDLGTSSLQLEESGRGFTFMRDEPLDMRFNPETNALRASDIVNHGTREELEKIFKEYGEERFARRIAEHIADERKRRPILTTLELVCAVKEAIPRAAQHGSIHIATRTFQALRIATNNEFETIQNGVKAGIECLASGGAIAVISFHSLEDRIIKVLFKEKEKEGAIAIVTKKPLTPSSEEIRKNPRSRSAKLRIAKKN